MNLRTCAVYATAGFLLLACGLSLYPDRRGHTPSVWHGATWVKPLRVLQRRGRCLLCNLDGVYLPQSIQRLNRDVALPSRGVGVPSLAAVKAHACSMIASPHRSAMHLYLGGVASAFHLLLTRHHVQTSLYSFRLRTVLYSDGTSRRHTLWRHRLGREWFWCHPRQCGRSTRGVGRVAPMRRKWRLW
jgi:hypothetical protein